MLPAATTENSTTTALTHDSRHAVLDQPILGTLTTTASALQYTRTRSGRQSIVTTLPCTPRFQDCILQKQVCSGARATGNLQSSGLRQQTSSGAPSGHSRSCTRQHRATWIWGLHSTQDSRVSSSNPFTAPSGSSARLTHSFSGKCDHRNGSDAILELTGKASAHLRHPLRLLAVGGDHALRVLPGSPQQLRPRRPLFLRLAGVGVHPCGPDGNKSGALNPRSCVRLMPFTA